jgi:hypothetical protein
MRRVWTLLLIAFASISIVSPAAAPSRASGDQRFVGTWRLVSISPQESSTFGEHPTGLIYYDANGHMAVQIAPDRKRPSWPSNTSPSPEQALSAVTGYIAYFGTYTIDNAAHTVTHHREGALNLSVPDLVRQFEFASGDRLMLTPREQENQGIRLVWERLR